MLAHFFQTNEGLAALLAAISTIGAVLIAKVIQGRVRLIFFSPSSTFFTISNQNDGPPMHVRSGQVMIQNVGRLAAKNVKVVASGGAPAGYTLVPPAAHAALLNAHGHWILSIEFIAPKETITVQVLNGPNIDSVRCADCVATYVPVVHQRQFPKCFNVSASSLMIFGIICAFYIFWTKII